MNRSLIATSMLLVLGAVARAQPAPPPAPPSPTAPPPAAPPAPAAPVPSPGMRLGAAQVPVVGGNAAGARERALDEALRQAVDQALGELLDPAARTAQAKNIKALLARARTFVPRYRTLEEGEANGVYTIRVEAEVDEIALRRKLERPNPVPTAPPVKTGPTSIVVLPADPAAAPFATGLAAALSGAGLRARTGEPAENPAGASARVTVELTEEGAVRGTPRVAFSCRGEARVSPAPGASASVQSATARVFVLPVENGRNDCLAHLGTELATRISTALVPSSSSSAPSGDLRAITVDAEVTEPAAVSALLKTVRSIGLVSAADLTRIAGGRAELRVRTRAAAPALAAALPRGAGASVTLSDVEVAGDVIRLHARLRTVATAAPPPPPAPGATP